MPNKFFDYVIVGAGSSGCVLAARLAEESAGSVLLIEAGAPAEQHPETLTADGFKDAFANDALMWHRMSEAQPECAKRRLYAGSGRVVGGSGSVNGMVYTRGDRRDFINWPTDWQWDDICPAFEAIEQRLGIQPRSATLFAQSFISACEAVGMRRKDGLNDGDLGGYVGCNDLNYSGTQRRSSYSALLRDRRLPNLTIATGASVQRLVFDDAEQAVAVEYKLKGVLQRVEVRREVILCAGALETPKLLMLSGVGPCEHLDAMGIPVVLDAPYVGRGLQDHPNVCLFYRTDRSVDFNYPQVYAFDAAGRPSHEAASAQPDSCFVCYAAPASIKQSMLRMLPILALPGFLYRLGFLRALLRGFIHLAFCLPPIKHYVSKVFGIVVILGKPTSRGAIRLSSNNPDDAAVIDLAYYSTPEDRDTMLAAVNKSRSIAAQSNLAGSTPLSSGAKDIQGDRLWRWITAATMTTFHYCGSCRMGEDANSPVDARLRLKGLRNVRVADASVMPDIPVSALNAPSMMIGYRAAEFILKGEVT